MKQQIEKALLRRLKLILSSELYAKAKITALNSWVLPVVTYSFGIIKWTPTDLDRLDRLIRTTLTKHRLHHPNSSVNRLYLQRNRGGRGLRNLKQAYSKEVSKLHTYLRRVDHPIHRAAVTVDRKLSPLNLAEEEPPEKENKNYYSVIEEEWKQKELHGRYASVLNGPDVDKELSTSYLKLGYLLMETEGFIGAIQDQVIATKNYKKYILKQDMPNDRCRLCGKESETIQHISSACAYLAPRNHKTRHDAVAGIIHQAICKKYGLVREEVPYYKYLPLEFMENAEVKIYWDKSVITDREVQHNRPDILIFNKSENTAQIIDITVPLDHNLREAYVAKINKYIDLAHEIKDMYNLEKVTTHPVVISSNGLVERRLRSELEKLHLDKVMKVIAVAQKAIILGTCNTVRRVLTQE